MRRINSSCVAGCGCAPGSEKGIADSKSHFNEPGDFQMGATQRQTIAQNFSDWTLRRNAAVHKHPSLVRPPVSKVGIMRADHQSRSCPV
jgi:hypothetical protein